MGVFFFFQAEDGIRDGHVTGVQTCALPISEDDALAVEDDRSLDLGRDLGQMGERIGGLCHAVDANTANPRPILSRDAGAAPAAGPVLRRPRPAPRRDDRVLRVALVRAPAVPNDL